MFAAVLSDRPDMRERFCRLVGKESGKDDIGFYSVDNGGRPLTLIEPSLYPDKIQPLLYSLSMADCAVVLVDELTPKIGEIIVALDSMRMERGILMSSVKLPIAGTVLEKYETAPDMESAKQKLLAMQREPGGEATVALVDKAFSVKSVGNVALGVLKSGKIARHDRLSLLPSRKEIEVRSIQIGDADSEEAGAGSRFGIAYKGELLERGLLVPLKNDFQIEQVVNGKFSKSPFFRDDIKGRIHAYANMQLVEGTVTENDLSLSQPLAFEKGDTLLVVDPSNQKLRIVGTFRSRW